MSDKTAKDWEDRVVLLENENAQAKAREAASEKALAEARAEVAALRGGLEQAKAAEKARRDRDVSDYIEGLKAKALPNAITETELARVRALFDRGDDENARFVGGLLLKAATTSAPGGRVVPLSSGGASERAKADTAYQVAQLRAMGWTVETSADGTQITSKMPPRAAGK